jgi:uncharacterized protein (DUF1684 family)
MKIPVLFVKAIRDGILAALVSLLMLQTSPFPEAKENGVHQEVQYRKNREAWMRSPESPLALAGLFWLKSGINRFGTDPQNEIVLPGGTARAGHLRVDGQRVRIIIENPAVAVYLDHQRVTERELKTDADGKTPDLLEIGDLQMKLIQRGEQLGLRLINLKNPPLLRFSHLNFYEIDLTYRLEGKFIPYRPEKKIKVASITGQVEAMRCPGVVRFMLSGKTHSLEPVFETAQANELFFMFKDSTNGSETYEGGRYLYAELPRGDRVMLNFNQAHNPYCAYNSFSTCQIPPMQNWLRVPIRAGEKKYPQSH